MPIRRDNPRGAASPSERSHMARLLALHQSLHTQACATILSEMAAEAQESSSSVDYNLSMRRAVASSVKQWATASHAVAGISEDLHKQKRECAAIRSVAQDPTMYDGMISRIESTLAYAVRQRTHWDAVIAQSLVTITAIDVAIPRKLNAEFTDLLAEIQGEHSGEASAGDNQLHLPE